MGNYCSWLGRPSADYVKTWTLWEIQGIFRQMPQTACFKKESFSRRQHESPSQKSIRADASLPAVGGTQVVNPEGPDG